MRRRVLPFLSAMLAITIVCAACGLPRPTAAGKAREKQMLGLSIRNLDLPGVTLVQETSDPGRPTGSGPADEGSSPEVQRRYHYTGEQADVCRALQARIETLGWTIDQAADCAGPGLMAGHATMGCSDFTVQAFFSVTGVAPANDSAREVSVQLAAPYPDDEVSTAPGGTTTSHC